MPATPAELRVRIGGEAGFGIKAAGQMLARTFAHEGLEVFDLTEYPSLIRGGHNTYLLRASTEPVYSHVEPVDVLACLNRETLDRHHAEVVDGGAVIFDPDDFDAATVPQRLRSVPVPLTAMAREAGGKIMRNTVALGAVLGVVGFPLDPLGDSLRQQFARKAPEVAESNIAAARAGYDAARAACPDFFVQLSPAPGAPPRLLVDGNEAIGLGALAAGIGFYAAYPMTPASSLLHFMAAHEKSAGVVVKHTEDEIAAMNMVVGAAFGGTRAMCATSGGGFALMVEAFGMAGVSESAVVVGVFTRPGPATGMPTWTEQSDLRYVIHAAQGEFPRVVLAPGDREDAFRLTWQAFNLADQLQTPVVILGDSYLSDNRQTVPFFDLDEVTVERGKLIAEGDVADHPEALGPDGVYLRYKVTEDGVSWRALPGVRGARQLANSYEHDERGFGALGEEAAVRLAQNEKRMRKLELARAIVPPPARFGSPPEEADIGIVLFGTTKGPAREAARMLAREGVRVAILQVVTLWPFPAEEVAAFMDAARRTAVVEGNLTGQLESLVREHALREPDARLHRYDGRPFSPEQIARFVKEVL
ncbi:2-oxoacid:acceptor oxidoreductase subunit alpha [Coriobacteriia bacterium Es71-Z0120]|uniref:2-oxoacid:acceptor oxidoreductase subunit alpha n=1 Tax=Parvivirga hydrogeniphila TaxID=2939460 RepID=UPI002260EAB9|nr:2-oxoacid:acceptor oxidoreductase subunit alpha [Parvivirga hydrogeniphila]MCL4079709.1 2-oxoacid:acceptor oxidoreductase subunit alpha [Parvivirga hydrogeniphila]